MSTPHGERPKFGVVLADVLRNPMLSTNAKALYALLCTYAQGKTECWPKNETLATDLGVTTRSIITWMNELVDAGIVEREAQFKDGRRVNSKTLLIDVVSPRGERTFTSSGEGLFTYEGEPSFTQKNTSKKNIKEEHSSSPAATTSGFTAWWSLYPRKVGKTKAEEAYVRAMNKGILPETMIAGLRRQVGVLGKDLKFCPYPATWLNREGWDDVLDAPKKSSEPSMKGFR